MEPVIQEETTGCGLACVATIAGTSYATIKEMANRMGIFAEDHRLYSDTAYVRTLLASFGFRTSEQEAPFVSWATLPELALLATKWHLENDKPYWHWVVYCRHHDQPVVLDPAQNLKQNRRTDFEAIQPKWYIRVDKQTNPAARYSG